MMAALVLWGAVPAAYAHGSHAAVEGGLWPLDDQDKLIVHVTPQRVVAMRPLNLQIVPAEGANGLNGTLAATELAIRQAARTGPWFFMIAEQTFTGSVVVEGVESTGTFVMFVYAVGPLNPALPLDDPHQGGTSFQGVWRIVAGSGTGDLTTVHGSGQVVWDGVNMPMYTGTVGF
ncbi:MAG: hypothetical protein AB1634_08865 [Thermodesulfobacteriota bacterium]